MPTEVDRDLHLPDNYVVYPVYGIGWVSWTWLYATETAGKTYMGKGFDSADSAANAAWDHWTNALKEAT